jgi:hypothetical protein
MIYNYFFLVKKVTMGLGVVANAYNPRYSGGISRRITVQGWP